MFDIRLCYYALIVGVVDYETDGFGLYEALNNKGVTQ